jgi:hypothetical protein
MAEKITRTTIKLKFKDYLNKNFLEVKFSKDMAGRIYKQLDQQMPYKLKQKIKVIRYCLFTKKGRLMTKVMLLNKPDYPKFVKTFAKHFERMNYKKGIISFNF